MLWGNDRGIFQNTVPELDSWRLRITAEALRTNGSPTRIGPGDFWIGTTTRSVSALTGCQDVGAMKQFRKGFLNEVEWKFGSWVWWAFYGAWACKSCGCELDWNGWGLLSELGIGLFGVATSEFHVRHLFLHSWRNARQFTSTNKS
jgi:hypothetical protein